MTDFLHSLKADLLDRRMRPFLALVAVALLAGIAYAALGGGSSPSAPAATLAVPSAPAAGPGISVTQAPAAANQAVAETTSGSALQHRGASRDPFTPLPRPKSAASSATSSAAAGSKSSGGSSSAASSTESSKTSTGTVPAATPKPAAPAKPETVYHVAILFGVLPPGTPAANAHLTSYENLKRQAPLPSAKQPLVVFRGVTAGGKSATFTLVGEAILRGAAKCLPSASQCQSIELKSGQSEEFEYLPPTGAAMIYDLQLTGITSSEAKASVARRVFRGESKAGRELLRRVGLVALPGLRYSPVRGVLVYARRPALTARAHLALGPSQP